jgi:type II secretory pathway pseudopilin PulG
VWIETVLYTLIGLALIGIVLTFVMPRINEAKDKIVVEQTIASLNAFDEKIQMTLQAPGSRRRVDFTMKRGEFFINSSENMIIFVIRELVAPYSEPGIEISSGRVKLMTEETKKDFMITLKIGYNFNLTYAKEDKNKKFDAVSIPYTFFIENLGDINANGNSVISIEEASGG